MLMTCTMVASVGSLSYAAYGQLTRDMVLLNLPPNVMTYIVQLFYSIGILCSYCLQVIPIYKVLRIFPFYARIPDGTDAYPNTKSVITRVSFVVICATFGYFIPNLG